MGGDPIRLRDAAQLQFACQRRLVDTGSSWDLGAKLQQLLLTGYGSPSLLLESSSFRVIRSKVSQQA